MQVYVVVWRYMEHWVTAITICTRHTRVALSRVGTLKGSCVCAVEDRRRELSEDHYKVKYETRCRELGRER